MIQAATNSNLKLWHYQPYKQKWRPAGYGVHALSARELMVVTMIAGPMTPSQIAEELRISIKTFETYRARAFTKLGVKDNITLVYLLLARGKIQNPYSSEPNG